MYTYTVSFFGEKVINNKFYIEKRLEKTVEDLIGNYKAFDFLVGREGDFDLVASECIRKIVKIHSCKNTYLNLILPYLTTEVKNDLRYFFSHYDIIEICEEAKYSSAKQVYQKCYINMVNRSDMVVCFIEKNSGAAYRAMKYAEKTGKKVINIAKFYNNYELE